MAKGTYKDSKPAEDILISHDEMFVPREQAFSQKMFLSKEEMLETKKPQKKKKRPANQPGAADLVGESIDRTNRAYKRMPSQRR